MGTGFGTPTGRDDEESEEGREFEEPLGDALSGLLADVDVDSVDAVRRVREDG